MSVINLSDLVPKSYLTGEVGQVINDNGILKVQPLSFIEETPSSNGNPESFILKSFNGINDNPYKRRLTYLESTGTQYIDTGVKPDYTNGDSTYISFYRADYTGSLPGIFGCRETTQINGAAGTPIYFFAYGSTSGSQIPWSLPIGNHKITVDDNYVTVDNTLYTMPQRVICTKPMFLFANSNENGVSIIYSGMKLYEWKYYQNGVLAQHLIPVLDNNDIPCMYDKITNQLFYNQGTEQFLYDELT